MNDSNNFQYYGTSENNFTRMICKAVLILLMSFEEINEALQSI